MRPSRALAFQGLAIVLVSIANFLLVVVEPIIGDEFVLRWGLFAGEYLVVAVWIAWGRGPYARRLGAGLLFGGIWGASSWLGFLASKGTGAFDYWLELIQSLYVPPIALLITALPLALFRLIGQWQFRLPSTQPSASNQITLRQLWIAISVLAVALVCLRFQTQERMLWDVLLAAGIGVGMGALALLTCPSMITGLLQAKLRPLLLLPSAIIFIGAPWALARMIAIPGPGGAAYYAVYPAIGLGLTSLGFLISAVLVWRAAGYRLHYGRTETVDDQE